MKAHDLQVSDLAGVLSEVGLPTVPDPAIRRLRKSIDEAEIRLRMSIRTRLAAIQPDEHLLSGIAIDLRRCAEFLFGSYAWEFWAIREDVERFRAWLDRLVDLVADQVASLAVTDPGVEEPASREWRRKVVHQSLLENCDDWALRSLDNPVGRSNGISKLDTSLPPPATVGPYGAWGDRFTCGAAVTIAGELTKTVTIAVTRSAKPLPKSDSGADCQSAVKRKRRGRPRGLEDSLLTEAAEKIIGQTPVEIIATRTRLGKTTIARIKQGGRVTFKSWKKLFRAMARNDKERSELLSLVEDRRSHEASTLAFVTSNLEPGGSGGE